ncbi:unnamed protein product [Aspergillus oryzae var. brunneus]|uniref:Unnamed protein product n=2 Tax=Aspergillus oryzae TaxID=5062 RepID=A0AAN5BVV2_ASPOZ|nr:unnamed protein product [Aspergillus oryzae]GMG43549.1 unnamed protein product [Aspergillus oryzae var. brunneus]
MSRHLCQVSTPLAMSISSKSLQFMVPNPTTGNPVVSSSKENQSAPPVERRHQRSANRWNASHQSRKKPPDSSGITSANIFPDQDTSLI